MSASTTDRDIAERVAAIWGVAIAERKTQKEHHKPVWQVRLRGSQAISLMRQLRPLMGKRRRSQIDRALAGDQPKKRRRVPVCGTLTMYRNGCRCARCKAVKAAEHRNRTRP